MAWQIRNSQPEARSSLEKANMKKQSTKSNEVIIQTGNAVCTIADLFQVSKQTHRSLSMVLVISAVHGV